MLNIAQQSRHPTEMIHSGTINGRHEHVIRGHQPTIGQVVYIFLDNIKLRFGEHSTEVISILNLLGTFRAGEMSKKDTLVAIRNTLGDHADLKQDLLNILFHREADWGVGDFDFGFRQPLEQPSPSPQFLQPAHQPQMRLPRISPLWHEDDHTYYSQPWSSVTNGPMLDHAQSPTGNHFNSPAISYQTQLSPALSPRKGKTATASPSVLGVPVAVPIGQPIDEMPPPSKKRRRRQSSTIQAKTKEEPREEYAEIADRLSDPTQPEKKIREANTMSQGTGGPYIHSLCGKGFSGRSKVKKHHWGKKLDDLETTSGCWAKNNKPDVSWNEHPSCREGVAQRKPSSAVLKPKTLTQEAPLVPSMVPTSGDRNHSFADTSRSRQEREQPIEHMSSYHSHRLPTRSSFDDLLTAVNVASEIDAPRPQGRIDSVVSHLDAQAAAAEQNRQYITNWQNASDDRREESLAYGRQYPYTTQGLGLRGVHVPVHMALPVLDGSHQYPPPSRSFADSHWNNGNELEFDGSRRQYAALGSPFSPGADAEYR
ncbi:uncharacterized protein J4E88_003911 [Alternaria novae-zelandiae]|uniref:uncharacterized protein n=1 Tax=Alternaria novae-zelandiae TaxID=430562 RepID=UPI0020C578F7|nr:uncharacterized protein J4E88_003911 [Alternaria novae-zelandiae]KAI4686074.1 hypothetical protein J4E88_003911 [Alternaria novae-zelandiae]